MEKIGEYVTFKQLEQNLIEQITLSVLNSPKYPDSEKFEYSTDYSTDAEVDQLMDQISLESKDR